MMHDFFCGVEAEILGAHSCVLCCRSTDGRLLFPIYRHVSGDETGDEAR